MNNDFSSFDIRSLSQLLDEHNPEAGNRRGDSDSDNEGGTYSKISSRVKGPGDIGEILIPKQGEKCLPAKDASTENHSKIKGEQGKSAVKTENNAIWKAEELKVDGSNEYLDSSLISDPRKTPVYETHYRQSVTTEDVFLQMGNKTPGTASCEELIVEIHLPDEDYHKVQLNLKKQLIDLSSPIYFLHMGLPHPIDPRAGNAKWDQTKEKLTITLKLSREFDDLNF